MGRYISKDSDNRYVKYIELGFALIILLTGLVLVKYTSVIAEVLGVSFFTFQAISYIVDVYRKDINGEKDFITYAIYVSFFPQLLCGPISKAKEQIFRYKSVKVFDLENVEKSWVIVIYGVFLKLVIADRIAIYVDYVYSNMSKIGKLSILIAILLYSIQIYCDFAGYSLIAIGLASTFGIELPVNFRQPYFAESISDFWKRWHISLTSWFREYLYIPLGGNRKGSIRTYVNILIVFVISGIWHGAGMTFVLWGLLHGLFQVAERYFKLAKYRYRIVTYLLVSLLWVMFRVDDLNQALGILSGIFTNSGNNVLEMVNNCGLGVHNIIVLFSAIVVVFVIDYMQNNRKDVLGWLWNQRTLFKWIILYAIIFAIMILGIYGPGYDSTQFIYYQF